MGERDAVAGRVVIVMPTYNERQNLEIIVARIREAVPGADLLVVDDNSPDGTGDLADKLAEKDSCVQVMHRTEKAGLGRAYVAGFTWALDSGYDLIVEMDADGSHRPEDLPKLLVEAHRRLATPFTALSYTLVALVASLTGTFRRHGGLIRPLVAVLAVVALLALQLAVTNLAARNTALVPLIWVEALLPALVCLWLLFGPQARLVPQILVVRLGAA